MEVRPAVIALTVVLGIAHPRRPCARNLSSESWHDNTHATRRLNSVGRTSMITRSARFAADADVLRSAADTRE